MVTVSPTIRVSVGSNHPLQASFSLFLSFQYSWQKRNKCLIWKFANDCIQTADLWHWKRPHYQLSHNHSPAPGFYLRYFAPEFHRRTNCANFFIVSNRLHSSFEVPCRQCDQMVSLFFNIWPFATMKISQIMQQIRQSRLKILPIKK